MDETIAERIRKAVNYGKSRCCMCGDLFTKENNNQINVCDDCMKS